MNLPVRTSTPVNMIAPDVTDYFQDISEISVNPPQSQDLKKRIDMFDTPVFVFKNEHQMWHRVCLFSNNTQDVLYSNIRKLLLEKTFNEDLDVKIVLFHLQETNGEIDLIQDKDEDEDFKICLKGGEDVSKFVGWLTKEFKEAWGNEYDDDVPNIPFIFGNSEHKEQKPYPSRILETALTFKITPVSKRSPSVFLSCFYCCTSS